MIKQKNIYKFVIKNSQRNLKLFSMIIIYSFELIKLNMNTSDYNLEEYINLFKCNKQIVNALLDSKIQLFIIPTNLNKTPLNPSVRNTCTIDVI